MESSIFEKLFIVFFFCFLLICNWNCSKKYFFYCGSLTPRCRNEGSYLIGPNTWLEIVMHKEMRHFHACYGHFHACYGHFHACFLRQLVSNFMLIILHISSISNLFNYETLPKPKANTLHYWLLKIFRRAGTLAIIIKKQSL